MSKNSIGPMFVRLHYTSAGRNHVMTFSVQSANIPPIQGEEPGVIAKGGTEIPLTTGVNAYVAVLAQLLHTTGGFSEYEAYYMANPTATPVWMYADAVAGGAGLAPGSDVPGEQLTMSFKTQFGGRFHIQLMETVIPVDQKFSGSVLTAHGSFGPIAAYVTGTTSIVRARDGGYLSAVIQVVTKTNDHSRRSFLI